jgi:hypothetical protein
MSNLNPSVNRWLADKHMDHIDHALGRPIWPLRETYRNHFAISVGDPLAAEFDGSLHWTKNFEQSGNAFYSVTPEGREALATHLAELPLQAQPFEVALDGFRRIVPALTRGKAKYAYYLDVSDSCPDLTFSDFCKRSTVRRAA